MLGAPPSCLRIVTRYVPARTFRSNPSHIDRCRQAVNVIRPGEVRIGHVRVVQVCSGQLRSTPNLLQPAQSTLGAGA